MYILMKKSSILFIVHICNRKGNIAIYNHVNMIRFIFTCFAFKYI